MIFLQSCILRPWRWTDRSSLALHANNRNVSINLKDEFPWPYTLKDADNFLTISADKPLTSFAAIEFEGEAIGGIGLEPYSDINRFGAELSYWLAEKHWGKGIGTEVVRAYTEYIFQQTDYLRLVALVLGWNRASVKVLEKCEFLLEGRMQKACFKANEWTDQLLFAKLKK